MTVLADQEGKLQFLPFLIEAMNFSFRLSNSCVRFRDSSAESLARGGRSILISLMSFNLLAITYSVSEHKSFASFALYHSQWDSHQWV